MKLKQILLFTLCISFFACSTDSSDEENKKEEETLDSTLLTKITYNKGTMDEYSDTFTYDGNKLTSVDDGDGWKNVYTYENDMLIKDEFFNDGVLEASVIIEYNSDKKVTKYTETFFESSGLDDRKYESLFIYNNDGTITKEIHVSYNNADFELYNTLALSFDGKNMSEISYDDDDSVTLNYDDMKGKFQNVYAIEVLNILSGNEFGAIIYGNTHNMTSYTENGTSSFNNAETFEYIYNVNGYPISAISTDESNVTETLDFIYE